METGERTSTPFFGPKKAIVIGNQMINYWMFHHFPIIFPSFSHHFPAFSHGFSHGFSRLGITRPAWSKADHMEGYCVCSCLRKRNRSNGQPVSFIGITLDAKASFSSRARRCIVWRRMPSPGALFRLVLDIYCMYIYILYIYIYILYIYIIYIIYIYIIYILYIYIYLIINNIYITHTYKPPPNDHDQLRRDLQLCRVQCRATTRQFWEPYCPAVCRLVVTVTLRHWVGVRWGCYRSC